ncbi:MAG: hypothetical protein ACI8RZ_005984 [Myxococcota bacterium]
MILLALLGCPPPTDSGTLPESGEALASAALSVTPKSLEFGDLPRGCTAEAQSVTVANTGGADLSILSVSASGSGASAFTADLPAEPIPGGSTESVPVTFTPTALYDYALPLTVQTDAGSAVVTVSGVGVVGESITDTATLTLSEQVDVLLVVDHTESMADPLVAVGDAMPALWASLTSEGASVHLGVVTMDMEEPTHSGRLQLLLTESDDAPTLPAPTSTATELGLTAMLTALSEPLRSTDNADFRREDTPLSVVVFSDEDDNSDVVLSEVEGWLHTEGATLHAVVEARKPGQICETEPGARYLDLQEATGGRFISLCTDDPAAALSDLARTILGVFTTFPLSHPPDSADGMAVTKNGEPIPPGLTDGWTLDTTERTVTLHGTAAPAPDDVLAFTYTTTTCP